MRTIKPHKLLDTMIAELGLKNDARIAKALEVFPSQVSKIRSGTLKVSSEMILRIHDLSGWKIKRIKELVGAA